MGLVLIVILMMCDENESEIGFGSFDVGAAAAAHGPSQHSQSAHFFFFLVNGSSVLLCFFGGR